VDKNRLNSMFMLVAVMAATQAQTVSPASRAAATCTQPDQKATIVRTVVPSIRGPGNLGRVTVLITVDVDAFGKVSGAKVSQSSGYAEVDRSVMRAALASTYKAAIVNCAPASGSYTFRADFRPGP